MLPQLYTRHGQICACFWMVHQNCWGYLPQAPLAGDLGQRLPLRWSLHLGSPAVLCGGGRGACLLEAQESLQGHRKEMDHSTIP